MIAVALSWPTGRSLPPFSESNAFGNGGDSNTSSTWSPDQFREKVSNSWPLMQKAKPQCAWAKSYAVGQRALRDAGLEQLPVTFQFCAIFGANVKGYPMGLML